MKSLLETLFGALVAGMVILLSINLTNAVTASTLNSSADLQLDRSVRALSDEMQLQLRNASRVLESTTVAGTTYTTGASTLVVAAPAYNASNSSYFLPGQDDTVVFTYDSARQEVKEIIVPSQGSARPSRTLFTIGRDVSSLVFTYKCREAFVTATARNNPTYTLAVAPSAASVKVYINGAAQTATVAGSVVTVSGNVAANALVQVFYSPQAFSASAPILEVAFTSQQSGSGARAARTLTGQGNARLRNYRN